MFSRRLKRVYKIFLVLSCLITILCFQLLFNKEESIAERESDPCELLFTQYDAAQVPKFLSSKRNLPNLPIEFWRKRIGSNITLLSNKTDCHDVPHILNIHYNNIHWQELETRNEKFYFYTAYYDNREAEGPVIRILNMVNAIEPKVNLTCNIWFDEIKHPVAVKVKENNYIWNKIWGKVTAAYESHMMTCNVPKHLKDLMPQAVSIVENCEKVTNFIKVINNKEEKKRDVAVCVKGLDLLHKDMSSRLIEWFELLKLLGADKVFIYNLNVHPNVLKVLNYYESQEFVEVTPITFPGHQPNAPFLQHYFMTRNIKQKRHNEILPYNDCLYKNLNSYNYIAVLDIDEVIMPIKVQTWSELLHLVEQKSFLELKEPACYRARNTYFFDDHSAEELIAENNIPQYMHMLRYVYRADEHSPETNYAKCFFDTRKVISIHNHIPISCLNTTCRRYTIDTADAQLQHYRSDCVKDLKKSCMKLKRNRVKDTAIWKYRDELILRTKNTLLDLGLLILENNI